MNKHITLTVFLFFHLILTSLGSSNPDSLLLIWNNTSKSDSIRFNAIDEFCSKNAFAYPDSVLSLANDYYKLAQEKNTKKDIAKALDHKALTFCVSGDYDKALVEMEKVLAIFKELKEELSIAAKYNNIGSIYYYQGKHQEAIKNYSLSRAIYEEKNVEERLAHVLTNIGLIHYDIDNLEFALEYFNKALALFKKIGIQDEIGTIWLNIGSINLKNGAIEEARVQGKKALKILQVSNNSFSIADCYSLFSESYQQSGQIDSALYYVKKSLELNQELGNNEKIITNKILLAELIFETNPAEAQQLATAVLQRTKKNTDKSSKKSIYKLLYKCYKEQGDFSLALAMHEKYIAYSDSLSVEENQITIVRESIRGDFKQAQIQLKSIYLKKISLIVFYGLLFIGLILFAARKRIREYQKKRAVLLTKIEQLKRKSAAALQPGKFQLDRPKIEQFIERKINETDWIVLGILLDDPVISNKGIAEKAFMTTNGIGSSLRRMYSFFDIKESKYKKISLIMEAIKISNN